MRLLNEEMGLISTKLKIERLNERRTSLHITSKVCTLITYGVRAMREYTNTIECRVRHKYKKKGATCDLKVVMLVAVRAT